MKTFGGLAPVLWCIWAFPASAEVAGAADFQRLCMATHARPADVVARSDADGWVDAPAVAASFARPGETWQGREIHPASDAYRALAAYEGPFGKARQTKCYLVTKEPFAETAAALQQVIRFKPKSETATATTWELMEFNGVVRSTRDISPKEFDKPFHLGPQVTIRVSKLDGGAILYFSEIGP